MHEMRNTEFQKIAESKVKMAIEFIAEAREDLTLWQLKEYVKENSSSLGGEGFLTSIGEAIANSTNVDFYEDIEDTLVKCEEYFDNKSDADFDSASGFIPNEEMKLLVSLRERLVRLRGIKR